MPRQTPAESVGLPIRPFFYSMDQLATLLNLDQPTLMSRLIYFDGRSTGSRSIHRMLARDIAPPNEPAIWRVAEAEFIRWLKVKKYRIHTIGMVKV